MFACRQLSGDPFRRHVQATCSGGVFRRRVQAACSSSVAIYNGIVFISEKIFIENSKKSIDNKSARCYC